MLTIRSDLPQVIAELIEPCRALPRAPGPVGSSSGKSFDAAAWATLREWSREAATDWKRRTGSGSPRAMHLDRILSRLESETPPTTLLEPEVETTWLWCGGGWHESDLVIDFWVSIDILAAITLLFELARAKDAFAMIRAPRRLRSHLSVCDEATWTKALATAQRLAGGRAPVSAKSVLAYLFPEDQQRVNAHARGLKKLRGYDDLLALSVTDPQVLAALVRLPNQSFAMADLHTAIPAWAVAVMGAKSVPVLEWCRKQYSTSAIGQFELDWVKEQYGATSDPTAASTRAPIATSLATKAPSTKPAEAPIERSAAGVALEALLASIHARLAALPPGESTPSLRPPAAVEARFRLAELACGMDTLPEALDVWFAAHDGQDPLGHGMDPDSPAVTWMKIEDVLEAWRFLNDENEEILKPYSKDWLPIATNGGGDYLVYVLRGKREGQILNYFHDDKSRFAEAKSLEAFAESIDKKLASVARALVAKKKLPREVVDEDREWGSCDAPTLVAVQTAPVGTAFHRRNLPYQGYGYSVYVKLAKDTWICGSGKSSKRDTDYRIDAAVADIRRRLDEETPRTWRTNDAEVVRVLSDESVYPSDLLALDEKPSFGNPYFIRRRGRLTLR